MSSQENQLRHVVVALVGVLQSYVTEMLEVRADSLNDSWDNLDDIDRRYVAVQARRRLSNLLKELPEQEFREPHKVGRFKAALIECAEWHQAPVTLARSTYRQRLDGFLQDNGSKVLNRAISAYGNCDLSFFNWLSRNFPQYQGIEDVINTIIATRNDVAHGTFLRRVTLRDVRIYRVVVYRLIGRIELFIYT